ncbi:MAG: hypothetical protein RIR00_155 [Pseudomonadota bacterium]|jgi:PAS domain S-box-containing protein
MGAAGFERNGALKVAGFLLATGVLLVFAKSIHYLLFHTIAELIAITVSFAIFTLTWVSLKHLKNNYLLIVGAAYGSIGLVDVLHTLSFKGMSVIPEATTNYPTQFWLTARFIEALALVLAPLLIRRQVSFFPMAFGFAVLAAAGVAGIGFGFAPATFIDGIGLTEFKVNSEYVIIALLLLSLVFLRRIRSEFAAPVFQLLCWSIVFAIATEICFVHYVSFYDFVNELGHYFRFVSVVLAFIAIVVTGVQNPAELLFREVLIKDQELHQLSASLRATIEASPVPMLIHDAAGQLRFSNRAFDRTFGCTAAELGTLPGWWRLACPDPARREHLLPQWQARINAASRSGAPFEPLEITLRCRDGREKTVLADHAPLAHAEIGEAIITLYDISELRQHREILQQRVEERTRELTQAKEAAEAANIAKSAFLSNMSHEMRTPLHQISGLALLIRREPLSQSQQQRLDKLDGAVGRMTNLVDAILDLTRLDADKRPLLERPLFIEELLDEVVAQQHAAIAAKGLQIETCLSPLPAGLVGDSDLLHKGLQHYLENAVRFTAAGQIRIGVTLEEEGAEHALLRFFVEDSGIGIPADDLPRLFQVFEQGDNSATRQYGGTGLGLALTRKIAQLLGGDAGCSSQLGSGSTFWFTVRLKKRPENGPLPG